MDTFKNMQDWKNNLDHFFGEDFWGGFENILKPSIPQYNLYQSDNEVLCLINIPGLDDMNKVDVYVNYATLEVRGIIDLDTPSRQLMHEEILQGSFERKIDLPFPVRSDKIDATYRNGLLMIQLHRLISQESNKNRVLIKNFEEK